MGYKFTKNELKAYEEDGYLIIRNCLNTEVIDEMMDFIEHVIRLEVGVTSKQYDSNYVLNKLLIDLKRANPSSTSWIYQTLQTSFKLKSFFMKLNIAPMVMQLLKMEDENNLGTVSPAMRFDIPGDKANIRTWHQDGNYFLENQDGNDHLVTWIPMNKATKDNGSVIIAKGSHKQGKQESEHTKAEKFSSEQYTSPESFYQDFEHVHINAEKGDIAFIQMDLVHSSGVNVTEDEVRYTAQMRFNTINDANYRPVMLRPEYPNYKRTSQKNN